MADESPLVNLIRDRFLKKIRGAPGRLRLPRRGRIRIVLLIALLVAGSKMAGTLLKSADSSKPSGSVAATAVPAKKSKVKVPESNVTNAKIGNRLSPDDVARVLGSARPEMAGDRDTIAGRGGSVIAWYSLNRELLVLIGNLMKTYKPRYGAAVVMDPASGRVLALVSYRNDSVPDRGDALFLRAMFPAASIFKTVTAAAAIEKAGYTAQTCIPVTGRNHTLYKFQLKKEIARNEEVTFEEAYAKSINPVFARVGMHVLGRRTLDDFCRRFCFDAAIPFELPVDTSRAVVPDDTTYAMAEFASGFNRRTSLSPLHGALIASAVAEGGRMPFPHVVDSISRAGDGACLFRSAPTQWKTCMAGTTAGELRTMMNRVVQRGTARKSFRCLNDCYWSSGIDYGGKTGSLEADSLGKIDWFVGFAKERNDHGRGLAVAIVTTHGSMWTVHSSYIASEIFRKYFRPEPKALADRAATVKIKG